MTKEMIVALAKFNQNGIDEVPLYKLKLDRGTIRLNGANKGLLIWPFNLCRNFHLHFYKDSGTGKLKAHIKDQKTARELPYNPSFRKLNRSLANNILVNYKKNTRLRNPNI